MNQKREGSEHCSNKDTQDKVPGRTIGITVMTLTIVFVAFWMNRQSNQLTSQDPSLSSTASDFNQSLDGFRADAWFLADDDLLGFVEIAAGPFIMGSNPTLDRMAYENERWSNLRRQGSVQLPTFLISRFETTVAQFDAFVQATQIQVAAATLSGQPDQPVTNITWPQALAYARWLEQQLRESQQTPARIQQMLDSGASVTLPSEAEWEKAARGTDGRVFPWGSQARTDRANFNATAVRSVGSLACPECAHGLSDMSGNVWELTRSPYQEYPYDSSDDNSNLSQDALWVMRGGSFSDAINSWPRKRIKPRLWGVCGCFTNVT